MRGTAFLFTRTAHAEKGIEEHLGQRLVVRAVAQSSRRFGAHLREPGGLAAAHLEDDPHALLLERRRRIRREGTRSIPHHHLLHLVPRATPAVGYRPMDPVLLDRRGRHPGQLPHHGVAQLASRPSLANLGQRA